MTPRNKLAVSLRPADTEECLGQLHEASRYVALAEVCLDLMQRFDLERIAKESPLPLVVSCRPVRERGAFSGSESERLAVLTAAMRLDVDYVDVEWDAFERLAPPRASATRIIASRHWHEGMPRSLLGDYARLRAHAYAVKLVGTARRIEDLAPVIELLRTAQSPVVAVAMGDLGRLSRLVAPAYHSALLTFGALTHGSATAAGQFTIREMFDLYRLADLQLGAHVVVHLCDEEPVAEAMAALNAQGTGGELHVGITVPVAERTRVVRALEAIDGTWEVRGGVTASSSRGAADGVHLGVSR